MSDYLNEKEVRLRNIIDTEQNWMLYNPVLLKGEIGFAVKLGNLAAMKVGDGVTAWANLPYSTITSSEIDAAIAVVQAQVNAIVTASASGGDVAAEVAQSRVNANGTAYTTLKQRLDDADSDLKDLKDGAINDYEYVSGYKTGFYDDTNNVVTYKDTNNTVACNKLPVHVPKGHIAIIDTKEFYVLTQFSGNNTVLGAAQVIVDGAATAGYLKSDYMVFPAHDYDVDLYFRVGNDKEHSTEISPENVDISVSICKPTSTMLIQGSVFIYIADGKIKVECSSTARSIVNGKFGTIQNTKTQLEKPTSGTFYICLGENGFYLRNATFLTAVDYPIAYYYSDTIFSYGSDSVYCNTIPLTNWYQREDIPIYVNNRKLNFVLDNRINQPYVDNFGYFYCVHNGYNYQNNPFYFANSAGLKLTTDSVVKRNSTSVANKKILTVGDSITKRGWYQQQIKTHEPTVEFLGTQTSYYNNIQCEGYSGRRAEHVLASPTILLQDGVTTIANPFYNPATEKIDFEYYCTNNNIHPDYVIIEFGLNEISSVAYGSAMRNFINRIKSYDSSIVIYVVQPFGESDNATFKKSTANQRKALKQCVLESNLFTDCVKIPCYFIMVDEYDYEKTELDYGYNNVKVPGDADGVHPKEETGFAKLGDMIYNWLGITD